MLAIESINDVSQLRQVALLLDRENARLVKRIEELTRLLAAVEGGAAEQELLLTIEQLEQQSEKLKAMLFAASSERRPHDEQAPSPEKAPRKGHGPKQQPQLPVVVVTHELPKESRGACEQCQGEIGPWEGQTEDSELVTVVRRSFKLEQHRRQKYRCRCGESIVTAPAPPKLIEGGRYSVEFGVEVAVDKYLNHIPLDRQRKMMRREGLDITTSALWDQVEAVASCLRPGWQAVKKQILGEPVIGADETRWRLITSPESEIWQSWTIASPTATYYEILPSRSAESGATLLGDYDGVVMVDGYGAYPSIARGSPKMILIHCWAHVRRKFVEIETFYPVECKAILDLIGKLYEVERSLPRLDWRDGADRDRVLAIRLAERRERSAPILTSILEWAAGLRQTPGSALRKAAEYMTERWAGLTRFVDDPRAPIDNNHTERAIRPVALGRKNHLGSKSPRGIEATAILYTMIETAKLAGIDPRAYVLAAVRAALETPRRVLLPRDLVKQ